MVEAGLQEIKTYVTRFQNTAAQYIAISPIMDLCLEAGWYQGVRVSKQWWDQKNLYLEKI